MYQDASMSHVFHSKLFAEAREATIIISKNILFFVSYWRY